jgi:hypothetical protein
VKLALDEHYSDVIATQLQDHGHDVVVVRAAGMAGAGDEPLLDWTTGEQRVLLTNNVQHFAPLHTRWMAAGVSHYGLWYTSDASMPRHKGTIGLYVQVLGAKIAAHPAVDAFRDQSIWLA